MVKQKMRAGILMFLATVFGLHSQVHAQTFSEVTGVHVEGKEFCVFGGENRVAVSPDFYLKVKAAPAEYKICTWEGKATVVPEGNVCKVICEVDSVIEVPDGYRVIFVGGDFYEGSDEKLAGLLHGQKLEFQKIKGVPYEFFNYKTVARETPTTEWDEEIFAEAKMPQATVAAPVSYFPVKRVDCERGDTVKYFVYGDSERMPVNKFVYDQVKKAPQSYVICYLEGRDENFLTVASRENISEGVLEVDSVGFSPDGKARVYFGDEKFYDSVDLQLLTLRPGQKLRFTKINGLTQNLWLHQSVSRETPVNTVRLFAEAKPTKPVKPAFVPARPAQ